MKRILVPTDFSAYANKALDYAVCIAKKAKAEIFLLHACELIHTPFQDQKSIIEEENKNIQRNSNHQLQDVKKCIEETEGINITTALYDGEVIDSILAAAKSHHPDLIVMGTIGKTGLKNKLFGSKTAALLSKSDVPVITIPFAYEWSEPKQILLMLNDSDENTNLFRPVFDLAEVFGSIVNTAIFSVEREEAIGVMEHTRIIYKIQEKLSKAYNKTLMKTVHLSGHDFQHAVQEYIEKNDVNLLAMITHNRSKMQAIFNKSMTKAMGYHTTIPLLSIRAQK